MRILVSLFVVLMASSARAEYPTIFEQLFPDKAHETIVLKGFTVSDQFCEVMIRNSSTYGPWMVSGILGRIDNISDNSFNPEGRLTRVSRFDSLDENTYLENRPNKLHVKYDESCDGCYDTSSKGEKFTDLRGQMIVATNKPNRKAESVLSSGTLNFIFIDQFEDNVLNCTINEIKRVKH